MRVEPASTLDLPRLRELFNEGFSEYLVPMQLDDVAFRGHVNGNDIDLDCSRVAIEDRPAALALIARRGATGWVGGMGTAPAYRRRGLGERALVAGLDAARERGCREVWLEVIDSNRAAIGTVREARLRGSCGSSSCGRCRRARTASRRRDRSARRPRRPGSSRTGRAASPGSAPTRASTGCARGERRSGG